MIAESLHDPAVFATIFDRHHRAVHHYLARRVGAAVAEDLAAETFLRAFDHRSRYNPEYPDARPWLLGWATNLLRRHRRTEARMLRALARASHPEEIDPADRVADRVDAAAASGRLLEALAGLAERDRDVVLLIAWEGLSQEEVATALGIPVGTVRSRLHRARRKLRAAADLTGATAAPVLGELRG